LNNIDIQVLAPPEAHYPFSNNKPDTDPSWYKQDKYWIKDIKKLSEVINILIKMKNKGYNIMNTKKRKRISLI